METAVFDLVAAADLIERHRRGPTTSFTGVRRESCAGCPWHGPSHSMHVAELLDRQAGVLTAMAEVIGEVAV